MSGGKDRSRTGYVGDCPDCGKRRYLSRSNAKRAARINRQACPEACSGPVPRGQAVLGVQVRGLLAHRSPPRAHRAPRSGAGPVTHAETDNNDGDARF